MNTKQPTLDISRISQMSAREIEEALDRDFSGEAPLPAEVLPLLLTELERRKPDAPVPADVEAARQRFHIRSAKVRLPKEAAYPVHPPQRKLPRPAGFEPLLRQLSAIAAVVILLLSIFLVPAEAEQGPLLRLRFSPGGTWADVIIHDDAPASFAHTERSLRRRVAPGIPEGYQLIKADEWSDRHVLLIYKMGDCELFIRAAAAGDVRTLTTYRASLTPREVNGQQIIFVDGGYYLQAIWYSKQEGTIFSVSGNDITEKELERLVLLMTT